ncbi:hypothetical protein [Vibrio owensii]|uniref:hypothetical protein n=1 Tax=Vibrio harveyi group TaxID=717610 RepID=UPI003CC697CA
MNNMNTQNKRNTLTLQRAPQNKEAAQEADYLAIANSLTPEQQNGVVTQETLSDAEAIAMANNLSPEMQNQRHEQNAPRKSRNATVGARFANKPHRKSTVDARNKHELETFETPKPVLDVESQRMDRETGGRFHGAGLLGRNRKRRQRNLGEHEDNIQMHEKVAVNENPFSRWL